MKKILAALLSVVCIGSVMVGCSDAEESSSEAESSSSSAAEDSSSDGENNEYATGKITMDGSTSMEKLVEYLKETLEDYDIILEPQYTGSGSGIEAVAAGTADIGNSSRALKEEELEKGLVANVVAIDGIAVVVNPSNGVDNLTQDELAKIYTGEITNWSEVGGADEAIVVIGREAGSGTRDAFEELLDIQDECAYAQEINSTGGVMAQVASVSGGIGYISLDVMDETVKGVALDGVEPTEANIKAGDYFLSRPFVMATMGEISEQSEVIQSLFDFIKSEEGQAIITEVGLIIPD